MFQIILYDKKEKYCIRHFDEIAKCFGILFMRGKKGTRGHILLGGKILYSIEILQDGPQVDSVITDGIN